MRFVPLTLIAFLVATTAAAAVQGTDVLDTRPPSTGRSGSDGGEAVATGEADRHREPV